MELEFTNRSYYYIINPTIIVWLNGCKLNTINLLIFSNWDSNLGSMLENLSLLVDGDHVVEDENNNRMVWSEGNKVTFSDGDGDNNLEITLPKNLCIPIFKKMMKIITG